MCKIEKIRVARDMALGATMTDETIIAKYKRNIRKHLHTIEQLHAEAWGLFFQADNELNRTVA